MTAEWKAASAVGPAAVRSRPEPGAVLAPRTVYWIAAVALLALGCRLAVSEGGPSTALTAMLVCAATGAVVALATRRLLIAVAAMAAQVLLVSIASWVKLKYMHMVLHAYDLAFYLTSWTTLTFLWDSYRLQVLGVMLPVALAIAGCTVAYRIDPVRISRATAALGLAGCIIGASLTVNVAGERRHSQFEYEGMYLSSFYRSWWETVETVWRGQLIEAAPSLNGPALRPAESCSPTEKPPHILLIHHESVVPPAILPKLDYDRRLDPFFRSDNGRDYGLRVETYGGASVLTEFSVLTGLSTYSFGGMRLFVQRLMAGKVKETLPQVLSQCGYRNVMFYPMLKSFTSADKFFGGVGIHEIFDLKRQGARRVDERDRFYYGNALEEIGHHLISQNLAGSSKPIFAFIETQATHWPYDKAFEPKVEVPGGGPGTHPEMHEYLRRLWLAKLDYEHLRGELARRFPNEKFLIVRYGDHHPMATRVLLGYKDGTEAEDVLLDRKSIGFLTFFAVNGVNFVPRNYESPAVLDVPYLSTVLLEAAGLPLTDAYKARQRLKEICDGQKFDCPRREHVLNFHRQLLDAGLVSAR